MAHGLLPDGKLVALLVALVVYTLSLVARPHRLEAWNTVSYQSVSWRKTS
ncbi:MAG: hypothetical protein AVDCRST_MAG28-3150 [uncultured Rubrobacteraceae bacterium]|uniref:Uncharacterized protein n=1 Tax=uncultured Rubrobacteraceae bacterium TaxID=349277 RepID=A0A6J4R2I4_9ACTN|nr:MAG: hypothetical protein AVDCRST_MAG28-3150 [uncultured Rubrobacteraceae bacterium]